MPTEFNDAATARSKETLGENIDRNKFLDVIVPVGQPQVSPALPIDQSPQFLEFAPLPGLQQEKHSPVPKLLGLRSAEKDFYQTGPSRFEGQQSYTPLDTRERQMIRDDRAPLTDRMMRLPPHTVPEEAAKTKVSLVTLEQFTTIAKALSRKIDLNSDGYYSNGELATAMQSHEFTGQNAQVVAALTNNRKELANLSNDEYFDETDGITAADLDQFSESYSQYQKNTKAFTQAANWLTSETFTRIDADKNGFLTSDDLMKAPSTPESKEAIAYIRDNLHNIEEVDDDEFGDENDGFTKSEFTDYGWSVDVWGKNRDTFLGIYDSTRRTADNQNKEICAALYRDGNSPLESINPDAPKQGVVGNCAFIAALSAVAATDPALISKMIESNADGTYTVTFPGAPSEAINVTAPTAQENGIYSPGSKYGSWAAVLEKAYGQYCAEHFWRQEPFRGTATPQEATHGNAIFLAASELTLLTGRAIDTDDIFWTADSTTARKLAENLSGPTQRAVVCGIRGDGGLNDDGWHTRHAYSVLKFEPDGQHGGMLTIRNPWGDGSDSTSGTKRITMQEFRKNFSEVKYVQAH